MANLTKRQTEVLIQIQLKGKVVYDYNPGVIRTIRSLCAHHHVSYVYSGGVVVAWDRAVYEHCPKKLYAYKLRGTVIAIIKSECVQWATSTFNAITHHKNPESLKSVSFFRKFDWEDPYNYYRWRTAYDTKSGAATIEVVDNLEAKKNLLKMDHQDILNMDIDDLKSYSKQDMMNLVLKMAGEFVENRKELVEAARVPINKRVNCRRNLVAPYRCQREAKVVRVTTKGIKVPLCIKCDRAFGDVVGRLYVEEKEAEK